MANDKTDNSAKRLMMSLLVAQGVSASTVGKIVGISKQAVSQQIPVSDIQNDIKRHEQNIRREAAEKARS